MRSLLPPMMVLGVLAMAAAPARADDPLVEKVRRSIEDGKRYLLSTQKEDGSWERDVLAEACCGDKRFDKDFRALMKRLYPDAELKLLPADYPVWKAAGKFTLAPNDWPLLGVVHKGRTVVIYARSRWRATGKPDSSTGGESSSRSALGRASSPTPRV